MAHFAEIDENNIVTRVVVVPDAQEHRGQEFCADDLRLGGTWVQTSYNNNIRKQFAGINMIYNPELDMFIGSQPYQSWTLDGSGDWQPPVARPDSEGNHMWNEDQQQWEQI